MIIHDGLRRMYVEEQSVYYYLTVMNENYVQPAMPSGVEAGILKGMYLLDIGGRGMGAGKPRDVKSQQRRQDLPQQKGFQIGGVAHHAKRDELLQAGGMRVSPGRVTAVIGLQQPQQGVGCHGVWAMAFSGRNTTSGSV